MTLQLQRLIDFVETHPRIVLLTGAGISTGSGIPDYRDEHGNWKRAAPVQYADFLSKPTTRKRYWARSLMGWPWFARARSNASHHALAALEGTGRIVLTITQNVDRLHQQAGSKRVVDLHGRLDRLVCLGCGTRSPRAPLQAQLTQRNPSFAELAATMAPDGDADIGDQDFAEFEIPGCGVCGGILKPDVVFFGESVPKARVAAAMDAVLGADALLICGSSLMVYSGFRFCRAAAEARLPMAAVNLGATRADALLDLKVTDSCESILPALARILAASAPSAGGTI